MPSGGILAETIEAIQDIAAKEIATVFIERAVVGLYLYRSEALNWPCRRVRNANQDDPGRRVLPKFGSRYAVSRQNAQAPRCRFS